METCAHPVGPREYRPFSPPSSTGGYSPNPVSRDIHPTSQKVNTANFAITEF
jgi:hypothetical protein